MKYQISSLGYSDKPTKQQFKKIVWEEKDTDLPDLVDFLSSGHIYRNCTTNLSNKGKKFVLSSKIVFIDVENCGEEPPLLEDYISNTKILPTFYYCTYNGCSNHRRYRLGYLLDKEITNKSEYSAITKTIVHYTGILSDKMVDSVSYNWEQNICGTNCEVFCTYHKYKLSELRKLSKDFIDLEISTKTQHKFNFSLDYEEYDLMCDFFQEEESFEGFLSSNKCNLPLVYESYPSKEDDTFYYYDNYVCLVRKLLNGSYYHKIGKYYYSNTFHDGEHRRKKIKINCSIIHQIYPDCSLIELLCLTIQMFLILFSNDKEDTIGREFIWETVIKEFKEPLYAKSPIRIKKRFKNKEYDSSGNIIHFSIQKKNHYKNLLLSMYDYALSLEDNLININNYLVNETIDSFRFTDRLIRKYLNEENLFFVSNKEKPITILKRMIKSNFSKNDCLEYLINNKKSIGINQFYKYKKILD